jgi:hypothetical protein
VSTPSRNYTSSSFTQLYIDLNDTETLSIFTEVRCKTLTAFLPPLVDTYVLHGSAVNTDATLEYNDDFQPGVTPPKPSKIVSEDGDGTVSLRSLLRAQQWTKAHSEAGKVVEYTDLPNVSHYGILQNAAAFSKIVELLMKESIPKLQVDKHGVNVASR